MKNKYIHAAATMLALCLLSSCGGNGEDNNTTVSESKAAVSAERTLSISDSEELPKSSEAFTTIGNPVTLETSEESSAVITTTVEKTEINKENEAAESRLELPQLDDDYIFITRNTEHSPDETEGKTKVTDGGNMLYESLDTAGVTQTTHNSQTGESSIVKTNDGTNLPASSSAESTLKPPISETEKFWDDNEPIVLPEL